jgi:hypothetical protein
MWGVNHTQLNFAHLPKGANIVLPDQVADAQEVQNYMLRQDSRVADMTCNVPEKNEVGAWVFERAEETV